MSAALVSLFVGPGGLSAEERPRAVLVEPATDRGVVAPGEIVVHEFVVRNEGSAPLTLQPGPRSRGARVEVADASIGAGAAGRVRVAVDTWAMRGPVELIASVVTNDPDRREIGLRLRVEVRPFVLARPGTARFIVVRGADPGPIAQTLWSADGADFRVLGVESPHLHVRVDYREAAAAERASDVAGRQWRVAAAIAPDSPVGALTGFITVRVDHPRQPEVRIPLSGFVRPMFAVTPPVIALGDVDARVPRRLTLSVKNFGETPADLTGVASDVPGLTAEVVPLEPGRRYRLEVVIGPGTPEGAFNGMIAIRTSSQRQPVVEVPVTGRRVGRASPLPPR